MQASSDRSHTPRRQPKPVKLEPGPPSSVDSWDARIQWKREASTSPGTLRQRTKEEHQSQVDTGARGPQDDQPPLWPTPTPTRRRNSVDSSAMAATASRIRPHTARRDHLRRNSSVSWASTAWLGVGPLWHMT